MINEKTTCDINNMRSGSLSYGMRQCRRQHRKQFIDTSAAERTGTSDEIAEAGAFLLGEHAGFITGTDLLIDGGVIASIRTGQYKLH